MYYIFKCEIRSWRNGLLQARPVQDIPYNIIRPHWWFAKPLTTPLPLLKFLMSPKAPGLDNYFTGTDFELYSLRLIKIISNTGIKFESFPVTILDKNTQEPLPVEYRLFHLLERYSAIDTKLSDLEYDHMTITRIRKLVLSNQCLESGKLLFRVTEMKSMVLIHRNLKTIFDEAGITGCNYIPYEEYQR